MVESIKPHVKTLQDRQCFTACDILQNVHGVDEMVLWNIPRPLAMNIYDVIEEVYQQTNNASKYNVKRQVHISAQFETYILQYKSKHSKPQSNRTGVQKKNRPKKLSSQNSMINDTLRLKSDLASAIERDVLHLPLTSPTQPLEDVLFKSYFMLCDLAPYGEADIRYDAEPSHHILSRSNYEKFLDSIVSAQIDGNNAHVKQLVTERMEMSRQLATTTKEKLSHEDIETISDFMASIHVVFSIGSILTIYIVEVESSDTK